MSETATSSSPQVDTQPKVESKPVVESNLIQVETEQLANEVLDQRAEEVFNEIQAMSPEEQTIALKDGTPESALHLYHKFNNLKPSKEPLQNPINLSGSPIILYSEGNSFTTIETENAKKFKITSIVGADTIDGQLMAECWIEDTDVQAGKGTRIKKISIPVSTLKNTQAISEQDAILADSKLTESQKKLIQINNQAKKEGAENVDYSIVRPALKEVAEQQGKLLNEPLQKALQIHRDKLPQENLTPEQQQMRNKIDQALQAIEGRTIATPEGYAAVLGALGPASIQESIQVTQTGIANLEQSLKNAPAEQRPDIQKAIADEKNKLEKLNKSLEFFNDESKLVDAVKAIQSGEMPPEVAKKINEKMANGDFKGALGDMVENKFNQMDEETKKNILEKLGIKTVGGVVGAGLAIALMIMIMEATKQQ